MFRVPLSAVQKVDSVDLRVKLELVLRSDGDSLFVFSPTIRCKETCETVYACYTDSCNFYRCGGSGANWPTSYLDYYDGDVTGWQQFDIDGECRASVDNDTVVYGFATRRFPDGPAPTAGNEFCMSPDTSAMLIYWFSETFDLLSPPDSSTVGDPSKEVTFVWETLEDTVDYYRVYIATDSAFTTDLDSNQVSAPNTTYAWPNLDNGDWWWQVKAFDDEGDITVSESKWLFFHRAYNDISYQSADGISPDTIQFICSVALDEIRTPGYWKTQFIPDWNLGLYSDVIDCFHGRPRTDVYGCDSGYCASYWLRAESGGSQPLVVAAKRGGGYNDFWMTRAYFLLELEEPIPDTTALDSMKFYMQFASVNVGDGDSIHIVTYEPRYSNDGVDPCYVCYGCDYPPLYTPLGAWCNYWECGDHRIWGDRSTSLPGVVPTYLGWNSFPIHPNIIDFTEASVGDTFGIGLVLRFEDSPDPTDTNRVNIMVGANCPYIVYWFSESEEEAGFINWGLKPPYLNWGLPINQPRRMYGGGKGR